MLADHAHELARQYALAGGPPARKSWGEDERRARFDEWAGDFAEALLVLKQAFNQAVGQEALLIESEMARRTFSKGVSLAGIRYRLAGKSWLVETAYPEIRVYRIEDLSKHPGEPLVRLQNLSADDPRIGAGGLVLAPQAAALAVFETMVG